MLFIVPVLADIGQTLTNLYTNMILPAMVPFAVIFLSYGAILWVTGSGSDDVRRVGRGKTVIFATLAGVALVLLAGQIGQGFVSNVK